MNFRKPLSVLAFIAFAAPLSAYADAPSGDFHELFAAPGADAPAIASDRDDKDDRRSYAEFSVWDLVGENDAARTVISREDVLRELASSPMPPVEA
ncbi:MAG: hypothetical protein ACXWZR_18740 [Mycobacterium sp.]